MEYIENQKFEKINFSENQFKIGEYENCKFINCDFSKANLGNAVFAGCEFLGCNLSGASLRNTAFKNVKFIDCKLLGLHFENCNTFLLEIAFTNCNLNLSTFYKLKLKNTKFINCQITEVDFTETDLTASLFDNCDLGLAVFSYTIIEKADLSTSFNFTIDPEQNKIKKAKFSLQSLPGLLNKYDIFVQ